VWDGREKEYYHFTLGTEQTAIQTTYFKLVFGDDGIPFYRWPSAIRECPPDFRITDNQIQRHSRVEGRFRGLIAVAHLTARRLRWMSASG
jgi:hypothetical protein